MFRAIKRVACEFFTYLSKVSAYISTLSIEFFKGFLERNIVIPNIVFIVTSIYAKTRK